MLFKFGKTKGKWTEKFITQGSNADVEYWIQAFNNLAKSIKIDNSRLEYMDLIIKETDFIKRSFSHTNLSEGAKYLCLHSTKNQSQKTDHKIFVVNEINGVLNTN